MYLYYSTSKETIIVGACILNMDHATNCIEEEVTSMCFSVHNPVLYH